MADVTRRQFLRSASIGAAAAGVLGAGGVAIFSDADAGASTLTATPAAPGSVPAAKGNDIFAHVADVSRGTITVFHGDKTYTITDKSLAAALSKAVK